MEKKVNINKVVENEKVRKFCKLLSEKSKMEIIPVNVENFSIKNDCYNNVKKQVELKGGKALYGWIIHTFTQSGSIDIVEAEAHAIWENEKGKIMCISPQKNNEIIFLKDTSNIVQENITIPNFRATIIDNLETSNMIKISELKDYVTIEIKKYLESKLIEIQPGEQYNIQKKNGRLTLTYKNKSYELENPQIMKLFKVLMNIRQIERNPILFKIEGGPQGLAKDLDYEFKYCLKL